MKKKVLLLSVLSLLVPVVVKADMGAPEPLPYLVTPKTENVKCIGTDYSEGTSKEVEYVLKKGENYQISFEASYAFDHTTNYASELDIKYNDDVICTVNVNDVDLQDYTKIPKATKEAIVIDKDGVDLYEGPSSFYKKTGSLKQFDKIKVGFDSGAEGDYAYVYVDANGKKGWTFFTKGSIALKYDEPLSILTSQNLEAKDLNTGSISMIEARTEHKVSYYTDRYTRNCIIEENGKMLLIPETYMEKIGNNSYIRVNKSVKLYKTRTYEEKKDEVIDTIPKGEILKVTYYMEDHGYELFYVTYNDKTGFVSAEYDAENQFTYVNKDGKEIDYDEFFTSNEEETPKNEEEPTTKKIKDVKKQIEKDYMMIIYVAIGVCVGVVLAIVIMILINKKMKKKNASIEETKEETVKVEENKEDVE